MFHAKMAPQRFAAKEPLQVQFLNRGLTFHVKIQRQFWFAYPFERACVAHERIRGLDNECHHAIIFVELLSAPFTLHDVPPATPTARCNVPRCNPDTTNLPAFSTRKYPAIFCLYCDSSSNFSCEVLPISLSTSYAHAHFMRACCVRLW
mgnify:CR=1 FL=1